MTTAAHFQKLALKTTLNLWIPQHEPREKDPFYKVFHAAKRKMRERDDPCWRCGVRYEDLTDGTITDANPLGATQLEAHHDKIEFSVANAIDRHKVEREFHIKLASDAVFANWVESEGNLLQVCDCCHRSPSQGIHWIPYPQWRLLKFWRDDLPPAVAAVS